MKPIRKPSSVLDNHLSRPYVTTRLKRSVERRRVTLTFTLNLHSIGVYRKNTSRYSE